MNKTYYLLAIFFLAISIAAGIFNSVILLQNGYRAMYLQSYATWFLISNTVYFVSQLFIVGYFRSQQWRFLFVIGIIAVALFLVQFVFEYAVLVMVSRELTLYYSIIAIVYLLATVVFAGALVFFKANKNKLLRLIGVLTALQSTLMLLSFLAGSLGVPVTSVVTGLIWLGVFSNVFPFLYLIVFAREINIRPAERNESTLHEILKLTTLALGMISIVTLLTFGGQLNTEGYWARDWEKRGPEEARKLAERFEARIYIGENADTLHYLLLKPLHYDSALKYPMVTCLHGGPARVAGSVNVVQPAPLLSESENRKKYPAFLFVPQAPPGVLWGGIPDIPSIDNLVFEAMAALELEFSIDTTRRYVAGISGGGYGSWHFICKRPGMFAAAMPMCGAGDPALAKNILNVPVWAFHGTVDRRVPASGSRNMIEAMKLAGGNPKYSEFAGVGHDVWPAVVKTNGVLDWMFAQQRK